MDVRDAETIPDGHVRGVHKIFEPMSAMVAATAFAAHPAVAGVDDTFDCVDCATVWGWAARPHTQCTPRTVHLPPGHC